MRRLLPILLALLIAAPAAAETLAITGVTAWTMTGPRPVEDATILVADGRIASVVAHGAVPAGARIVEGKGRIVTPGPIWVAAAPPRKGAPASPRGRSARLSTSAMPSTPMR